MRLCIRSTVALLVLIGAAIPQRALAAPPAPPGWEEIASEEGVTVWQHDVPNTPRVEFRGRGLVKAPITTVLAVLRDSKRKTEWLSNCVQYAVLHYASIDHLTAYNRTGSPYFFIEDRDVVLNVVARYDLDQKAVFIDFHNVESKAKPPVDGVVRIPRLVGHWYLYYRGPQATEVEYQVEANAGGSLPKWLVDMASKRIPLKTILNLRNQVKKSGYEDDIAFVQGTYDWELFEGSKTATRAADSITVDKSP